MQNHKFFYSIISNCDKNCHIKCDNLVNLVKFFLHANVFSGIISGPPPQQLGIFT